MIARGRSLTQSLLDHFKLALRSGFTVIELLIAMAILAVIVAIALPSYSSYRDRVNVAKAIIDIREIQLAITQYQEENRSLPLALSDVRRDGMLDPWGRPYVYLNLDVAAKGKGSQPRKDKNLVPINTDYDLYSMGKNGQSVSPLTAAHSRDDIVRANNGRFVGLAADY